MAADRLRRQDCLLWGYQTFRTQSHHYQLHQLYFSVAMQYFRTGLPVGSSYSVGVAVGHIVIDDKLTNTRLPGENVPLPTAMSMQTPTLILGDPSLAED
jgi:hypothetical protein